MARYRYRSGVWYEYSHAERCSGWNNNNGHILKSLQHGNVSGSVSGNVVSITMSSASCTGMLYGSAKVLTNTMGRQEMAFTASGTFACSNQSYDNTITGTLIKQ